MADYIEREAVLAEYDRQHNGPPGGARKIIAEFPAADVVLRDCYNAILWENDVMRKELAEIGKGFGQKMYGVAPVMRCRDCKHFTPWFKEYICGVWQFGGRTKPDNFCSAGKKRNKED